jgi:hypothetical protein
MRWEGASHEVAFILHSQGVDAVDISSQQNLFACRPGVGAFKSVSVQDAGPCAALLSKAFAVLLAAAGSLHLRSLEPLRSHGLTSKAQQQLLLPLELERLGGMSAAGAKENQVQQSVVCAPPPLARRCPGCNVTADLWTMLVKQGMLADHLRPWGWQVLLSLPGNVEAHKSLVGRGPHPAFDKLSLAFPVRGKAGQRLHGALSCLAHWTAMLAELPYIPVLTFPVTQVFKADHLATFEFVVMFFLNWGREWLDFFPGPPVGVLSEASTRLEVADPDLFSHLRDCASTSDGKVGCPALAVFWPLLQTLLSEVLSRSDWLALWDFLVARWQTPKLLSACCVTVLLHRRKVLLALPKKQPHCLDEELRRCRPCPPACELIKHAESLLQDGLMTGSNDARRLKEGVRTSLIPKGLSYPMLPGPSSVTKYHATELARIEEQLLEKPDMEALHGRLAETRVRLAESVQRSESQDADLLQQRKAEYSKLQEDAGRWTSKRYNAQDEIRQLQLESTKQLRLDTAAVLRRHHISNDDDICKLTDELEIRRQRRAADVAYILQSQNVMNLEDEITLDMTDSLKDHRMKAANEHIHKLADICRMDCEVLGDLRTQQVQTYNECAQVKLQADLASTEEAQRVRAAAQLRRKVEADLSLQNVLKELHLGRDLSQKSLDRVRAVAEALEAETMQLQEKRQTLADADSSRAEAAEDIQWERLELREHSRRRLADLRAECDERSQRQSAEEDALLSEVRRNVVSKLSKAVAEDAAAAEEAEVEFRHALYGLDDIRRAREEERRQLLWK